MINAIAVRRAWAMLDGRERRMALVVLAVVVVAALSSALMVGSVLPFMTVLADPSRIESTPALARAYESFGFSSSYAFLVALGLASLFVVIAASAIQILRTYVLARFALMQIHKLSHRLLSVYLRQPYEFFLDHHSGDLGTKLLSESQEVVHRFFLPAASAIAGLCSVLALVGVLLWVNWVVALLSFLLLGGSYAAIFVFTRRRLSRLGERRAQVNRERYRLAGESLGGVKDIKLLGREATYIDRYEHPSSEMAWTQIKVSVLLEVPAYTLYALAFGGMIILCLLLLDPVGLEEGTSLAGILPLLGVFAFAGQRLMPELNRLYQGLTNLQYGTAALDAVYEDLLLEKWSQAAAEPERAPLGLDHSLRFANLGYRYPDAAAEALKSISLEIGAGERIGLVGSSGAGKSTLADILLGLLRPSDGHLIVDGTPLTEERVRAWQRTVGYVPQDIFLTDSSVAENIALGVPPEEIDHERLVKAARIAQLERFIEEELPAGYDTTVGERGVRLSGGQKQRIGIARALYHDADLIVFDEATSALDNLTEREVMAAIDALPGDTTIVIIAHRLTTVRSCDRILVLEKGRVAGIGSWAELANENRAFKTLALLDEAA